jgi:hypothetical protein
VSPVAVRRVEMRLPPPRSRHLRAAPSGRHASRAGVNAFEFKFQS